MVGVWPRGRAQKGAESAEFLAKHARHLGGNGIMTGHSIGDLIEPSSQHIERPYEVASRLVIGHADRTSKRSACLSADASPKGNHC
jgi:hypothetical protein